MPGRGRERGPLWALLLVAGLGAALRVAPLISNGRFASKPDYDDGVNFTAAALLARGVLPYRDFFYAHPPGGILFLAPAGLLSRWVDPARAFTLAGLGIIVVSALTIFLLGRLWWRAWGPAAGLAAALLYAVHPEVLTAERTTFMEPVLNLTCIVMATVWLGRDGGVTARRALVAGAVAGLAVTVKAWGLAWLVAGLVAAPRSNRGEVAGRFAAAAAAAALLVTLPFALPALGKFVDGTVFFQLWRPPDGTLSTSGRLHEVLGFVPHNWSISEGRHAATSVLAMGGLLVAAFRARLPGRRAERLVLVAYVLTVAMFLSGQSYYTHYNAHLALAEAALAGLFAGAVHGWLTSRRFSRVPSLVTTRLGPALLAAVVLVAAWLSAEEGFDDARERTPELVALGAEVRRLPDDTCLFAFEPMWGLAGGRLPSSPAGGPTVIDPYGAMIFDAVRDGARFDDLGALFADERSQRQVREVLEACRFVILGERGEVQLSDASKEWFRQNFVRRYAEESPIDIWERTGP